MIEFDRKMKPCRHGKFLGCETCKREQETDKPDLPVMCELVKKEYYRSKSLVNMTDDMVRITLSMERNEWVKLRKLLKRPERAGVKNENN